MKKMVVSYAGIGVVKPAEPPKSGIKKADPDEGRRKAQRLLITWISENPSLLGKIEKYISVSDFTEDVYRRVTEKLFEGIKQGDFEPASMVSMFEDEEEQKEVALLFNTKLTGLDGIPMEIDSGLDKEKAFHDILVKVKSNSLEYYSSRLASDVTAITKVVEGKKMLEELKNTKIHLE